MGYLGLLAVVHMEILMDDYTVDESLIRECGCEVCRLGNAILRMTFAYGLQPLPLYEYICPKAGGVLTADPGIG